MRPATRIGSAVVAVLHGELRYGSEDSFGMSLLAHGLPVMAMTMPTDSEASPRGTSRSGNSETTDESLGLFDSVRALWAELPGLLQDCMDLLGLELTRAVSALMQMVMLMMVVALLGVTALLALWAGAGIWLVEHGLRWMEALLVVIVLNAGVAWWALWRLRCLLPLLRFPAMREYLALRAQGPGDSSDVTDEQAR